MRISWRSEVTNVQCGFYGPTVSFLSILNNFCPFFPRKESFQIIQKIAVIARGIQIALYPSTKPASSCSSVVYAHDMLLHSFTFDRIFGCCEKSGQPYFVKYKTFPKRKVSFDLFKAQSSRPTDKMIHAQEFI